MSDLSVRASAAAGGDPIGRFLAWADAEPARPAVDVGGTMVTYGALATGARRFAASFAGFTAPNVLIALPPGVDGYAAIFGTLLAGGCYIPVNVAAPENKLARVVDVIAPDIIVAGAPLAAVLAARCPAALLIDPETVAAAVPMAGPGQRGPTAYVIMTSGSTGVPKGVVIPTSALAHYVNWVCDAGLFRAGDRVSQFNQLSFDVHVLDLYGALSVGAMLVPPTEAADRLFPADYIRRGRITAWVSVPSAIDLMISGRQATAAMLGTVRQFATCGEPLRPSHLAAVFAACPEAVVMNMYGPTETTVTMTAVGLRAADYLAACNDTASLGEPIVDTGVYLLGGPDADEGEIVITGPQLATGYWADPERTAQAFRMITVDGQNVRAYFSGDWGQRIGGRLYFKGRIDQQVKIRGYRVETGEVVARLAECGWPVACVVKHNDALIAVVEVAAGAAFDPLGLRARLQTELEAHAVPERIVAIGRMPYNSNGKLDEAAMRTWLDTQTFE